MQNGGWAGDSPVRAPRDWFRWMYRGALIAGTFDILYATGFSYFRSGIAPSRILQSVASGLLGAAAYEGGAGTAVLGLALHYLIAFIVTAIFFAGAWGVRSLVNRPEMTGPIYGLGVYGVMNYVVIPLSKIGPRPTPAAIVVITGVLVHMFFIGLPIAVAARKGFVVH